MTEDMKAGRNDVKAPLNLVPMWALYGCARVCRFGDTRYAPGNWKNAAADRERAFADYADALLRHWSDIQEAGWDSVAPDSGLPHIDHLITNALFIRGLMQLAGTLPKDPGKGRDIVAERSRRALDELTRITEEELGGYDDPSEFQKTEGAAPSSPAAPSLPSDLVGRVVKRFDGRDVDDRPPWDQSGDFGETRGYGADGGRYYARKLDWTITHQRDGWAKCAGAYDLWFPVDAIAELA